MGQNLSDVVNLNVPSAAASPTGLLAKAPLGELSMSELMAKYSHMARSGRIFSLFSVTAAATPTIYTATTGVGGGLLWNKPNSGINLHILGASLSIATATSVPTAIGIGGANGQNIIPTTPTAATVTGPVNTGGAPAVASAVNLATVLVAAQFFIPLFNVGSTNAATNETGVAFVDIGGLVVVPPGSWCGLLSGATPTSGVFHTGLVWAELSV